MENIKKSLSDIVHQYAAITIAVMFLFSNTVGAPAAQALIVKPKTEVQLKKETLEKYSNTVYKPSQALSDEDLKDLTDAKKVKEISKDIKSLEKAKAKLEKMMHKGKAKSPRKEVIDETDSEVVVGRSMYV